MLPRLSVPRCWRPIRPRLAPSVAWCPLRARLRVRRLARLRPSSRMCRTLAKSLQRCRRFLQRGPRAQSIPTVRARSSPPPWGSPPPRLRAKFPLRKSFPLARVSCSTSSRWLWRFRRFPPRCCVSSDCEASSLPGLRSPRTSLPSRREEPSEPLPTRSPQSAGGARAGSSSLRSLVRPWPDGSLGKPKEPDSLPNAECRALGCGVWRWDCPHPFPVRFSPCSSQRSRTEVFPCQCNATLAGARNRDRKRHATIE